MDERSKQEQEGRHAYMLAWRDRMIEKQRAIIEGQSEAIGLLEALLAFALGDVAGVLQAGEGEQKAHCAQIPKTALAEMLGAWECAVEDGGESYVVSFTRRQENAHAESCGQDAQ